MLRSSKPQIHETQPSVQLSWRDSGCVCHWVQVISHINDTGYRFLAADTLLHPNNISENTGCLLLLYLIETEELADENTKYGLEKNLTSSSMQSPVRYASEYFI